MRVRDRARAEFGMWLAIHACRCRRAAKSSRWALRSELQAYAPGDRRGSDDCLPRSLGLRKSRPVVIRLVVTGVANDFSFALDQANR